MSFARRAPYRAPILAGPSGAPRHDARGVVLAEPVAVSRHRADGRSTGRRGGGLARDVTARSGRTRYPTVGGPGHRLPGAGVGAVVIPFPVRPVRRAGRTRDAAERASRARARAGGRARIDPPLRLTRRGRVVVGGLAVLALGAAMLVGLFLPLP